MPGTTSKTTTNHNVIRKWIETRNGHPATVRRTGTKTNPGLLRVDFPGYRGKCTLQAISWDEFFEKFDEKDLVFLYQDKTASGKTSRFCKFVYKGDAKTGGHNGRESAKSRSHSHSSRKR